MLHRHLCLTLLHQAVNLLKKLEALCRIAMNSSSSVCLFRSYVVKFFADGSDGSHRGRLPPEPQDRKHGIRLQIVTLTDVYVVELTQPCLVSLVRPTARMRNLFEYFDIKMSVLFFLFITHYTEGKQKVYSI